MAVLQQLHPGDQFLHARLWEPVVEDRAPFMAVEHDPPVDLLDADFPIRLTTGRRLESFNTGVQTGGFSSPLHVNGSAIRLAPEDGARLLRGHERQPLASFPAAARSRPARRAARRCGRAGAS